MEEPLPAGGSCLLGSINLSEFVNEAKFDYSSFAETVRIATRCLNDVLEEGLPLHPLEEQRQSVSDWRQIGLGIMGLADMLIKMGVRYGSKEAVCLCDSIGRVMINSAVEASAFLARERGPYPKYRPNVVNTPFFVENIDSNAKTLVEQYGLRNSQLLTIAPTGTLSTMLGISGGVEPIFANFYTRKTESLHGAEVEYKVYTPIVREYMEKNGLDDDSQLPSYFVTAGTLDHNDRISMQAVWQKYIDASISSTINLPSSATVDDVKKIYLSAWEKGLKGITIFRSGCKRAGILTTETEEEAKPLEKQNTLLSRGDIIECSEDLIGKKRKLTTGCGSLHVLAFFDPSTAEMQEVYLNKGSTGGCANFMTGLSRTLSLLCRAGVSVYDIKDQLDSTGACPSYATRSAVRHDTSKGACCPMAIGNALIEMYEETMQDLDDTWEEAETAAAKRVPAEKPVAPSASKCPECGEPLIFEGGCCSCRSCGYSKCG